MANSIDPNTLKIWHERCLHLAPRSFVVWYDCIQQAVKTYGLADLGYSDLQFRTWKSLCELLHPDHQKTIELLIRGINRRFSRSAKTSLYTYLYKELTPHWSKGVFLSIACSVKKAQGQFWSAHAIIEPFNSSSNNKNSAFFIWVQITGEYMGTPLIGSFFSQKVERNQNQVEQLNLKVAELHLKILEGMQFTSRQYKQILLMKEELPSQQIAEALGISLRTLEGHRNVILQKGREYFNSGSFRTAQDFIEYLQLLIPK
jgi:hypothetical protein